MRLVLCLLFFAPSLRADQADEAQRLLDDGVALFQAERLSEARALFVRAQERVPSRANPYRWLGLADARLGRCKEAVGELDRFLSMVKDDDLRADDARAIRDRCRRELEPPPAPPVIAAPAISRPMEKPLARRPWFITVMSVGAGVVVAGVALGVGLGVSRDSAPPTSLGSVHPVFQ